MAKGHSSFSKTRNMLGRASNDLGPGPWGRTSDPANCIFPPIGLWVSVQSLGEALEMPYSTFVHIASWLPADFTHRITASTDAVPSLPSM